MTLRRMILLTAIGWLTVITLAHFWLNIGFVKLVRTGAAEKKFRIGFLPVT